MRAPLLTATKTGDAETLHELVWLEKHAELACRVSAVDALDPQCGDLLRALGKQYGLFARELRMLATHLGGPQTATPVVDHGASHRLLDVLFEQRDASTLLTRCEASERETIDAYRAARLCSWPGFVGAALDRNVRVHVAARFGLLTRRQHGERVVLDEAV